MLKNCFFALVLLKNLLTMQLVLIYTENLNISLQIKDNRVTKKSTYMESEVDILLHTHN